MKLFSNLFAAAGIKPDGQGSTAVKQGGPILTAGGVRRSLPSRTAAAVNPALARVRPACNDLMEVPALPPLGALGTLLVVNQGIDLTGK